MGRDDAQLIAMGVSHHTAPVAIRERFAMDTEAVKSELAMLRGHHLVREALVLSTCNRVELYAVPEPGAHDRLRAHLARHRGPNGESVERYLFDLSGRDAVLHLFRVASSLDSIVVGEPQILGQVKEAVRVAESSRAMGAVLNRLTQRSLWVAKQVRTHTDIGRFNVGIGNAGVSLATQIFSTLKGRRALLVGVGEMGRQVARAMLNHGLAELVVANRTFSKAVELAEEFGGTPVTFDRIGDYLARVDVVITATGATRPILGASVVKAAMRARRWRPLFLVDLAVPRNIDVAVEKLDQAYLFNVDDLTAVMERSRAAREAASQDAERIVSEEADRFVARLAVLEVHEAIGSVTRRADQLRLAELARSKKLAGLHPEQAQALDAMTKALVKKLLHDPLLQIRAAAEAGEQERLRWLLRAFDEREED